MHKQPNNQLEIIRHSLAHILATAVLKLYPDTQIAIGPAIEDGFYYDFDFKDKITPENLPAIEKEMRKLIKENLKFEQQKINILEAKEIFKNQKYKIELIDDLVSQGESQVSIYKTGNFVDLCRGPHIESTQILKNVGFKLDKLAGAYWRGDEHKPMLTRIYALAFKNQQQLDEFLILRQEAIKRDHRKLGQELDLFSFQSQAPGMPFWHNKGNYIWQKLVDWVSDLMRQRNYEINKTPIILNKDLWLQSGHWDHYAENMYFTKIDDQDFAVKPMNCPGNILIYKNTKHSYRELPIRAGEFGLVHRHELSGVLSGLFRVRCFTQDDAHIYCTQEQIQAEIKNLLDFMHQVYSTFNFKYRIELSTKPDKAMGDPKIWELAEKTLKQVLDQTGQDYKINEGDGAFYGPKIDFHLEDALGRSWQCGTIQLDFQMPEKFDLTYTNSDGQEQRPVMLHRTILGSVERFIGVLIEHYAGALPIWLSPVQIKIINVGETHEKHCQQLAEEFRQAGLQVELDLANETVGNKIRKAIKEKIPYMLVIGDKEMESKDLHVRIRGEEKVVKISKKKFIAQILKEIEDKK
ncbi:MAG: threonine--tRNA ligase [Patescibacteria group bacterium]|nr:threonine--tRNA ligase [Patescibacteria group bacterium]